MPTAEKPSPSPRRPLNLTTLTDSPQVVVLIDSREKQPLLFPAFIQVAGRQLRVVTERAALETADYTLAGQEIFVAAERKSGLAEIRQNLFTPDSARFKRMMARLARIEHPILLLESSVSELLIPTRDIPIPGPVVQRFLDWCAARRIDLLIVGECRHAPKRRLVGELLLRIMLAHARLSD